jgi:hypothetical protein
MSALPVDEVSVLQSLLDAVSTGHILEATAELGLLDHLTSGPKDASELAQACATDLSMTALLLDRGQRQIHRVTHIAVHPNRQPSRSAAPSALVCRVLPARSVRTPT